MGNVESSELTENVLEQSQFDDIQVLTVAHGVTMAPDSLPDIYRTALNYGSILTRNEHRQYKRHKLTRKSKDMDLVMQTKPTHSRARRKQLKYLQREMSYLTHNVDPFLHVLQARSQLLARAHLAFFRMAKRHELLGLSVAETLRDKKNFIESILTDTPITALPITTPTPATGTVATAPATAVQSVPTSSAVDRKFVDQIIAIAHTVPG